jgi:outer membrane lipoprotein-sorting protein
MKKTALLFMLILFISSCQAEDSSSIRYDMQGYIEDVRIDSEGTFINILVNGQMISQEGPTMIDYGWATVTPDTIIYLNGEVINFYPFEIDENINVLVQYDGEIMESYPVQGTALVVSIKKDS